MLLACTQERSRLVYFFFFNPSKTTKSLFESGVVRGFGHKGTERSSEARKGIMVFETGEWKADGHCRKGMNGEAVSQPCIDHVQ